jgi:hypothetical protein
VALRRAQTETTGDGVDVTVHRTMELTLSIGFLPALRLNELVNCNSYIAFAVHGSRASPRTACALTVHPELVEGFFELRRQINCYRSLEPVLGLNFQSGIYLDMAVPYGQASSQSMEFGHHWVVRKLLPDKFDKFPQFFLWNLCLTRYGLVIKNIS